MGYPRAFAVFAVAVGCGGVSERLYPGPPPAAATSQGGQDAAGAGAGGAGAEGGAVGQSSAGEAGASVCPAWSPDHCPGQDPVPCVRFEDDPANCGACDTPCAPGAPCSAGACGVAPGVLTSRVGTGPLHLALDGDTLYWGEEKTGAIRAMSSSGGPSTDLVLGEASLRQLVVADGVLYWRRESGGVTTILRQVPGAEPAVLKQTSGDSAISTFAVTGETLHYAAGPYVHAIATDPADSADIVVAASGHAGVEPSGIVVGLAFDDDYVYSVNELAGLLERDDRAEGTGSHLWLARGVHGTPTPALALRHGQLFFAAFSMIHRHAPDSETGDRGDILLSVPNGAVEAMAVGSTHVYATDGAYVIARAVDAPTDPESQDGTLLAREQRSARALVVDEQRLYWATYDSVTEQAAIVALDL